MDRITTYVRVYFDAKQRGDQMLNDVKCLI